MTGIFNGLQGVISNINTIILGMKMFIDFGINLIKSLIDFCTLLLDTFDLLYGLVSTLPSWLTAFAFLTISISILFMVVGRNHGHF